MSGLTEISIPDNVSTVPEFCFYRCYNLEVITIGKNVTRIEPDAFNTYSDIKAIYCKPITSMPMAVISMGKLPAVWEASTMR